MSRTAMKIVLAGIQTAGFCSLSAFAVANWLGGDGKWNDSTKWDHVPATENETAAVAANTSQTLTVDSSTAVQKLLFTLPNEGVQQTLAVLPSVRLTADRLEANANNGKLLVTGGGEVSVTNLPFSAGAYNGYIEVAVAGAGTSFVMPKPAGSGLYIGSGDKTHDATFRVTDQARVVISNATCLGQRYDINSSKTTTCPGGTLIVENGAEFESTMAILAGRYETNEITTKGAVVAVTNATLRCGDRIELSSTWNSQIVGSNATVQADGLNFPGGKSRYARLAFDDSTLGGRMMQCLADGWYGRGVVRGGVVDFSSTIYCANMGAWDGEFTFTNAVLKTSDVRVGGHDASNDVIRVVDCTVSVKNSMIVGYEDFYKNDQGIDDLWARQARDVRWEQVGGSLSVSTLVVGKGGTRDCGVVLRNVDMSPLKNVYVGDSANARGPARGAYAEFRDLSSDQFNPSVFLTGINSVEARTTISNSTFSIGSADDVMVGRSAGATGNVLEIVDSAVTQKSGGRSLFVGRDSGTTNNVFRLVRSTYALETGGSKGDLIVGYYKGAVSNRLELVASTFTYNRAWMSVGHESGAVGNAIRILDGSTLRSDHANSQLVIGNGGSGCRLEMSNASRLQVVNFVELKNSAVAEFAGAGNEIVAGAFNVADGTSFVFRPSAEAAATPVLTLAHNVGYGPSRPLTVDLTGLEPGKYRLVVGKSLCDPKDVPTTFVGLADGYKARLSRTADETELDVWVKSPGLSVLVR